MPALQASPLLPASRPHRRKAMMAVTTRPLMAASTGGGVGCPAPPCLRPRRVECWAGGISCPPRKKKLGGNGDDDSDGDEEDDDDAGREASMQACHNRNMIRRAFGAPRRIDPSQLHAAMLRRWGSYFDCRLVKRGGHVAVLLRGAPVACPDETDLALVTKELNRHGLGAQFVDYIKYDGRLRSPRDHYAAHGEDLVISLSVPCEGPRLCEWRL
jgi:hypothetical protein